VLAYLRRRYEFDATDGLLPPGTFLLPAENFEGNWQRSVIRLPGNQEQFLRNRHVTAEGPAADEGIKTTINVPRAGKYHVWVRAVENPFNPREPNGTALKTFVQGKELPATHARGPQPTVVWREAGEVELKAGPAEVLVRGQGPGHKDCDTVLISPTAASLEAVEEICALAQRLHRVGGESHLTAIFENGLRLDGSLLTGWRWIGPAGQISRPDPATIRPVGSRARGDAGISER
jgi:hypothetical protein